MVKIFDLEQGTDEWHKVRLGVPTASEFKTALAKGRGGAPVGATALKYAYKLAAEQITEKPPEHYSNPDMERGHLHEPIARELYEAKTGNKVEEVGFMKNEHAGYSPDGLVGDKGLIEIKSKKPELHIECIVKNKTPSEHIKQIQGGLWVSGRDFCDFVSYSPDLPLFIKREHRDEDLIKEIEEGIKAFNKRVAEIVERVLDEY